jgi:tetratricopeptide (TPR) repeat protein
MAGRERVKLLAEAVSAFRNALQVKTREQSPQDLERTQNELCDAYYELSEWSKAAECYANVLTLYPNSQMTYTRLSGIYHERLFEYELAFKTHQMRLTSFPDDLFAMPDFAETHFTTGRFAECRERIAALLAKPEIWARTKIGLRVIEIANLLALDQAAEVPAKLDLLIAAVAAQPAVFKITWTFNGTLHFIGQSEKLAARRDWLKLLFSATEGANREAALKTLREAKAGFKPY